MRSVLGMNDPDVALATGLPVERVRHLWLRSLFHLRETLPRTRARGNPRGVHVPSRPAEALAPGSRSGNIERKLNRVLSQRPYIRPLVEKVTCGKHARLGGARGQELV